MGRSSEVLKNAGEHGPFTMSYIGKLFGRVQPKEESHNFPEIL